MSYEINEKALEAISLDRCEILSVSHVTDGTVTSDEMKNPVTGLPDFYRVCLLAHPGERSNIRIEVWLPTEWNERLLGTGNGGIGGVLHLGGMKSYLCRGFAVVHTDLGTSGGKTVGYGNDDVKEDYCHRATHVMTVLAKELIRAFYGKYPEFSYFCGSSTGGLQAYTEAQRYPEDYNGINAGVPSIINTAYHTYYLWNYVHLHDKSGNPLIDKDTFERLLCQSAEYYQSLGDGEPGDSFITKPYRGPATVDNFINYLKGLGELNGEQLEALKAVYSGPKNPKTGRQICCGAPIGSEDGIARYAGDECPGVYPFIWAFGGDFDPYAFNFAEDFERFDAIMGRYINAVNPDLRQFRDAGGKLLAFSGTADSVVLYPETDIYYERAAAVVGGAEECMKFFRYFLLPGRTHGSGLGADSISSPGKKESRALEALIDWVEKGIAPDYLIGISNENPDKPRKKPFERPVYPYGSSNFPFGEHPKTYSNQ